MAKTLATSEVDILDRVISGGSLPEETARSFLTYKFTDADRERQNYLAGRAQSGEISAEEKEEADNYLRVSHFIAILQSRARQSLAGNAK